MYGPKDSDIFGTSSIGFAPRITNDSQVDPHAAFKRRTQQNYENYTATVQHMRSTITARPPDTSKVNENVHFEEDYHKQRKERDLKSTIFYESKHKAPAPLMDDQENQSILSNHQDRNYGKKETLSREIKQLPYNATSFKGNESRLFDLDTRSNAATETREPLMPLIPHQMQWDQHDSVKYANINEPKAIQLKQIEEDIDSKSVLMEEKPRELKEFKETEVVQQNEEKFAMIPKQQKVEERVKNGEVEILIIGWQDKYMEGLSKHVKLNKSAIVKFLVQDQRKVTLVLKKSQRWENVTDWLRKDCKLKIRVFH